MPENTSKNSENIDEKNLCLIQREISGCILLIIGYIVLIISARQDREVIFEKSAGLEENPNLQPSKLAAVSSLLLLLGNIILGELSLERLNQIANNLKSGTSNTSIEPNVYISSGFLVIILGNILKLIGATERANEQTQITIL